MRSGDETQVLLWYLSYFNLNKSHSLEWLFIFVFPLPTEIASCIGTYIGGLGF